MKGTANVLRRRMGLAPTSAAMGWATRVLMAGRAILAAVQPDDGPDAIRVALRRWDGLQPAYRRAMRLVRAAVRVTP